MSLSHELIYVVLLFVLLVVPRLLQRFRVPGAVTGFALGVVAGVGFHWFTGDTTISLLATLGIVTLFLFAGLEVDLPDLRRGAGILIQHLLLRAVLLLAVAWGFAAVTTFDWRVCTLVALALLTPSTGFILESIGSLGADPQQVFWIKSKAIATELLALGVLFVTLQSTSPMLLGGSVVVLAAMILVLPLVFRLFAQVVVPHAPRSEFAFLVMVAVVCAFITRQLGVYYLVGAFVVGMAAQRFREELPSMASERIIHAVELFSTFFVPFYFFSAGLHLHREDFNWGAVAYGLVFLATMIPLRVVTTFLHRRLALGEGWAESRRIAIGMLPTLVFGLVIAGILRERFAAPPELFGGLIVYTIGCSLIPALVFKTPVEDYESPHAPELHVATPGGGVTGGNAQIR